MPFLTIIRVIGDSLQPDLSHGDYLLAGGAGWMLRRLQPGDIVVFSHPDYGRLVKRVQAVSADRQRLYVVGSSPDSVDSRRFGFIARAWVDGKALLKIRQKRKMLG